MIYKRCNPNFKNSVATNSALRLTGIITNIYVTNLVTNCPHANINQYINIISVYIVGGGVFLLIMFCNEFYSKRAYLLSLDVIVKQSSLKMFLNISEMSFMIYRHQINPIILRIVQKFKKIGNVENHPYL